MKPHFPRFDDELKPCPFTGRKAVLINKGMSRQIWVVESLDNTGYGVQFGVFRTSKQAIKAWNKRVDVK